MMAGWIWEPAYRPPFPFVRSDLPEGERALLLSGYSLRAAQLGHHLAEMTQKYQRRRDRFRVNLTEPSGL